jgi:hypothetical protein
MDKINYIIDVDKPEPEETFKWCHESINRFYLIEDAYNAVISTPGASEFFKNISDDASFMFTYENHHIWDGIHSKMLHYNNHSGYSYAWTMHNIKYIFKHSWDKWIAYYKKTFVDNQEKK